MSDSITNLDRPYGQQPETRAAAIRVMERCGAADLIAMLGLDEVVPETPRYFEMNGRLRCSACWQPVRGDGFCRRRDCGGAR